MCPKVSFNFRSESFYVVTSSLLTTCDFVDDQDGVDFPHASVYVWISKVTPTIIVSDPSFT